MNIARVVIGYTHISLLCALISITSSQKISLNRSLEDTLEMTEDGNFPAVGSCFEELAEGEEFDVYEKYIQVGLNKCRGVEILE